MKKIIVIFLINFSFICYAQNMVNNPSFEEYRLCPNEWSQIENAINWHNSVEYEFSSDYFHECMFTNTIIDACPECFMENIIKHSPRTGEAFAGILTFSKFIPNFNYREAITNSLKEKLVSNKCYKISFYIKYFGFWNINFFKHVNSATNSIGMFIGYDSILYTSPPISENLFTHQPQINYKDSILKDSINWVKISGTFIANGGEQWITIANFLPDDSISIYLLNSLMPYLDTSDYRSYYLIDDVSVYPCDAPVYFADAGKDTCIKPGRSVTLGIPEREEYLYWWINGNTGDTISRQSQIVVNPQVTTTYILVQKDFKFDETRDSVTVTVGSCIGSPDYRGVDFEIFPNPNNGNFQVRFNTSIPDGAVLQLQDMLGRVIGEYKLEGSGNAASLNIEVAQAIYCATVIIPNVFKKSVKIVVVN